MVRAIRRVEAAAQSRSAGELVVGGVGLLLGLGVGALATLAIGALPYVGDYLLLPLFLVLGYVFASVAARQHRPILRLVGLGGRVDGGAACREPRRAARARRASEPPRAGSSSTPRRSSTGGSPTCMATGFIDRELVIPVFVLLELQRVADSAGPAAPRARQARARGDARPAALRARHLDARRRLPGDRRRRPRSCAGSRASAGCAILTTDYNLNRVAGIQGIDVLNINDLANALKPAVLPGESLRVKVLREGKEAEQGVGYLDDGTMIVIEGGRECVGDTVDVEVTSVLQSASGKMIFSRVA